MTNSQNLQFLYKPNTNKYSEIVLEMTMRPEQAWIQPVEGSANILYALLLCFQYRRIYVKKLMLYMGLNKKALSNEDVWGVEYSSTNLNFGSGWR
jgi:hypothetical protein